MTSTTTTSRSRYKRINQQGRWQALQLPPTSDGDAEQHPGPPYRPSDDENYLIQLAAAWKPNAPPPLQYYLEKLPDGYTLLEIDQPGGPQTYKRLFGHPKGRFYDSVPKFRPHFLWLMNGMTGQCECHLCNTGRASVVPRPRRAPRDVFDRTLLSRYRGDSGTGEDDTSDNASQAGRTSRRARRDVRSAGAPLAVDEEGAEDVYKKFVMRLFEARDNARGIDEDIVEINSLDWRAEHERDSLNLLPTYLKQLEHQPSYLPRIGELVLWCQSFLDNHYLLRDEKNGQYKFFSYRSRRFSGIPQWRAGVVTAVPDADIQNGPIDLKDVLQLPTKATALNSAGFRVETFPDPNDSKNKSASKQYKWVPLRSIRPLAQWQTILRGIPQETLHPSIFNALTCATSISLVEKVKCTGKWPNGVIHCKAVYLGPELIGVGDAVRLISPNNPMSCTDVLRVESIRLNLDDMKPEFTSAKSPYIASKTWISLVGKAYTRDARGHYMAPTDEELQDGIQYTSVPEPLAGTEARVAFHSSGVSDYGPWYHLHDPEACYEVSHEQVLGRLHELNAVKLWKEREAPSLNYDIDSILASREYATQMDARLPEAQDNQILWYWADTRALALAVESFNGIEVSNYWPVRDEATLKSWHEQIKILNGVQITPGVDNKFIPLPKSTRGRKPGTKMVNGKLVKPGDPEYEAVYGKDAGHKPKPSSQMAGAAMASTDEESGDEEEDLNAWIRQPSKEEDSVEIFEPRTVVNNQPSPERGFRPTEEGLLNQSKVKAPLSKTQIMSSAVMQSIESDQSSTDESDEFDWPEGYVPPARGGTEESSGGDYDPRQEEH